MDIYYRIVGYPENPLINAAMSGSGLDPSLHSRYHDTIASKMDPTPRHLDSVDFINYTHLSHEITKAPKTIKNTFFYCRKIFSNACLTYSIYCLAIAFFAPQPFLVLYGTEFFVNGMLSLGYYFIFKPTYLSDKEKMYCTEIAKYIHQFAAIQAFKEILELPISEVRNDGNAAYFSSQSKVCGLLNTSYTQYKFQSPEAIKQAFPEHSLARTNLFSAFESAQYPNFQTPVTDEAS